MERVKEGEYVQCALYTCMDIEQQNVEIILSVGEGIREKDGGFETNQGTL
jgi:hypothetical protein